MIDLSIVGYFHKNITDDNNQSSNCVRNKESNSNNASGNNNIIALTNNLRSNNVEIIENEGNAFQQPRASSNGVDHNLIGNLSNDDDNYNINKIMNQITRQGM